MHVINLFKRKLVKKFMCNNFLTEYSSYLPCVRKLSPLYRFTIYAIYCKFHFFVLFKNSIKYHLSFVTEICMEGI